MKARLSLALSIVAIVVAWLGGQSGPPAVSPQTFRTSTDVVMVDVSVRKGNTPVTGLTAADFELRDNGVRQDIETVEAKAVPIDLSIIVDVSGDPNRPWVNPTPMSKVVVEVDSQVRRLTALLRDGDRVRLFAIDTALQQVWPLQPAAAVTPVRALEFDGQSSLYNTLSTVLLQPVEPTRRHVIVAATKGLDTISSMTAAGVRAIAERSDAQLHLVMQERAADEEYEVRGSQCSGPAVGPPAGGAPSQPGWVTQGLGMDLCKPTRRFWVPAQHRMFTLCRLAPNCLHRLTPDGLELKAGAEATGGGLYQGEAFSEPTLFSVFAQAFENFRQSYVLRYSARGVTRQGWHRISVTVPRDHSFKIQARTGYAIDPLPPAPPPPPAPLTNASALRTLPALVSAYGRAAYDPVALNLRQAADPWRLIMDFERGGNPWPAEPRREAVFALELAEAGIFSPGAPAREEAIALLRRFAQLVRDPIEPDAFERAWLLGVVTMLQGTIRPDTTQPFVDRALAAFPDEPRFLLARAIVTDQRWPLSGTVGTGARATRTSTTGEHAALVIAQYEAAAAFPAVRAEALMRLGWFLQRVGRSEEAVARIQSAIDVDTSDRALAYLRELLLGQALMSADKAEDAVAAFRRALAIVPGTQSPRVALMNALLMSGDRQAADAMAEDLQTTPSTTVDPWWMYWQGNYRHYPQALSQARELIR